MTDSAEVPHESALHHLTEALGFGAKGEEHGWAGEKRAAASQMDQIGRSQHSTSAESKSTLSRLTEAVGLGGTTEGVKVGGGMEKREAAHEWGQLGVAHEESRDPITGDLAEEKGLPPLTDAEQREAAYEDGTPVGARSPKPEPLYVSKGGYADISKSPVSVLEQNDATKTEEVYSDKQSDIWGAVGVGAAEGAGVGVALGAAAAAAAIVAPPVTAVAAGKLRFSSSEKACWTLNLQDLKGALHRLRELTPLVTPVVSRLVLENGSLRKGRLRQQRSRSFWFSRSCYEQPAGQHFSSQSLLPWP